MEVVGVSEPKRGSAVTIGAYDGIHLGHRYVFEQLQSMAAGRGLETVVVTFDRHPATVVRPDSAPLLLTDLDQKLELIAGCGIDRTMVVPFDRARADESAEDFVTEILMGGLGTRLVVVGEDFHFGHDRLGNVGLLAEMGAEHGFGVVGLGLKELAAAPSADPASAVPETVSSTRIRRLLADGQVAEADRLLGRPHQVRGTVEHGDGRGSAELGIPTANVVVPPEIALPAVGIYAGWYTRPDGSVHPAAIALGHRPTFYDADASGGARPLLEAHLLDFGGDLYGEAARVSFVEHLRDEERFDSPEALASQMRADLAQARALLAASAPVGPGPIRPAGAPDPAPC